MPAPILAAAQVFDAHPLSCLQNSRISDVWQVSRRDGTTAVLKLYHRGMGNEGAGFAYLKQFQGNRAVLIHAMAGNAVLMEELTGPALGDVARGGKDRETAEILGDIARDLNRNGKVTPGLLPLSQVFEPMLDAAVFTGVARQHATPHQISLYQTGQAFARTLLARQTAQAPLHGDLHHDNVRSSARGYCAFDAKGLIGDPAYELANAFRHPRGRPDWTTDVARTCSLARIWAQALETTPAHLLSWAMAKGALSIFWQAQSGAVKPVEFQHLEIFDRARDLV